MKMPALLSVLSVSLAAMGLAGCGVSETDADRFEAAADRIAAIPLDPAALAEHDLAQSDKTPLRVELMTPHQLWDARDGTTTKAPRLIRLEQADVVDVEVPVEPRAPEVIPTDKRETSVDHEASPVARMIQLGAFANQAAAQTAWNRLGAASQGLSPVFEPVTVNGRQLVRLKVKAQSRQAEALCAVAAASDAWCMKAAS